MGYISDALNRFANNNDPDEGKPNDPTAQGAPLDSGDGSSLADASPAPQPSDTEPFQTIEAPSLIEEESLPPEPLKFDEHTEAVDITTSATDDRLVTVTEPAGIMAEEYRSIRTSMLAKWEQKRHLVHMITSATPQEGKTITTLNLGFSFAELRNRRIAVLEADLRLPAFDKMISLPRSPGLVGLLTGKASLDQVVHRLADDRLHVITAGKRIGNMQAVQLLSSSTMISLVKTLRNTYDHVFIDTPPVVELADAGILGTLSDEVLLIARMNRTPQPLIQQAIRTLDSYNASVGGLIATDQKRAKRRHYYYKYGYKGGYGYNSHSYTSNNKKAA